MDGLMLDTQLTWIEAEKRLLSDFGQAYSHAIARQYQGMRVAGVVEVMIREYNIGVTQSEGERLLTEYLVANFEHPDLSLFEGCRELMHDLHRANLPLAIASSSPSAAIHAMARRFELTSYFDLILSGEEVPEGKPAPDVYLKAAQILKVDPHDCVVLEDAPHGALAGKRAGMKVVAVTNARFYTAADFSGLADLVVASLNDLEPAMLANL